MKKILGVLALVLLVVVFTYYISNKQVVANVASIPSEHQHNMVIYSEEQFVREMIPHHQDAVDSSRAMLKSSNAKIKDLASRIVTAQEKEITQMKSWHVSWFPSSSESATYINMMPDMNLVDESKRDAVFLNGMIMHHQMAVNMAQQLLTLKPRPELKTLAENIIKTQTAEIAEMQEILKEL